MKMLNNSIYDISIIGGGIVGTRVARLCSKKYPNAKICLLEAEKNLFGHNSSKNSAVIHSGIYYTPNSIKALHCTRGAKLLKEYCQSNSLKILENGKIIIPRNKQEREVLPLLLERGIQNEVNLQEIGENDVLDLEPLTKIPLGFSKAIYVQDTAVGNLESLNSKLESDILNQNNIDILTQTKFDKIIQQGIPTKYSTNQGTITSKVVINVSGHDSLRIAQQYGIGQDYSMLPLKGYYLKASRSGKFIQISMLYPLHILISSLRDIIF